MTRADIIGQCRQAEVAVMPGAYTPTEIAHAWECGADVVKVFPARQLGPGYIKDVLAPMPYLKLMPTGGVDLHNIATSSNPVQWLWVWVAISSMPKPFEKAIGSPSPI